MHLCRQAVGQIWLALSRARTTSRNADYKDVGSGGRRLLAQVQGQVFVVTNPFFASTAAESPRLSSLHRASQDLSRDMWTLPGASVTIPSSWAKRPQPL